MHQARRPSAVAAMASNPPQSQPAAGATTTSSAAWARARCPADHRDSLPALLSAIEAACRRISSRVQRAGLEGLYGYQQQQTTNASGDAQKKLDVVSDEIFAAALRDSGLARAYASEEADAPVVLLAQGSSAAAAAAARYVVVFDPLDGSRNVDVAIPTGTIFGVYESAAWAREQRQQREQQTTAGAAAPSSSSSTSSYGPDEALADVLQPGNRLLASGYCLYSSSVVLALAVAPSSPPATAASPPTLPPAPATAAFFALDTLTGDFVATHEPVACPQRGQIYSLNDARFDDWAPGLRRYVTAVRSGKGQTGKQYSARYVCSLVADLHRTLLQGGWCGNPRPHLRLLYEGNPLAFLTEAAGGRASDGARRVLDIQPEKTHQRLPLFMGSAEDVAELESYGDVQQTGEKKYAV